MKNEQTVAKRVAVSLWLGALFSFGGWVLETVFCSLACNSFCERGFLFLPFCPIYGLTVLSVAALLGTPQAGGLLLGRVKRFSHRLPLYFLLATLLPTVAELVTGLFFERVMGKRLWDYSSYSWNWKGHICLWFSLIWGGLITLAMGLLYERLKRRLERLGEGTLRWIAALLVVAVALDAVSAMG